MACNSVARSVAPDPFASGASRGDELANAERGERALRHRVDGRHQRTAGHPASAWSRWSVADSLRHHAQRGGGAVVGQAIPCREGAATSSSGANELPRSRRSRALRPRPARRTPRAPCAARDEVREQPWLESGRHAGERQRGLGGEDRLKVRHSLLSPAPALAGSPGAVSGAALLDCPSPQFLLPAGSGDEGDLLRDRHVIELTSAPRIDRTRHSVPAGRRSIPIAQAMMSTSCSSISCLEQGEFIGVVPACVRMTFEEAADQQVGFLGAAMPWLRKAQALEADIS